MSDHAGKAMWILIGAVSVIGMAVMFGLAELYGVIFGTD